jgi:type IV pilus assembly protein PilV
MRRVLPPAAGFSLIECMVACVVICVGLMGIAKMQAMGVGTTTVARQRSLAALQAASLASAMHSNRQYWAASEGVGTPPASIVFNVNTTPAFSSSDAALLSNANTFFPANLNFCVGTSGSGAVCTPVQLAAYDLARWASGLQQLLPNAVGTVLCPPAVGSAPVSCTIQITWTEKVVAMNSQEAVQQQAAPTAQFNFPTYTLYVEP